MKRKLKIEQLKVQSFITSTPSEQVHGGGTLYNCGDITTPTAFSCMAVISCNPLACVIHSYGEYCITGTTRNTTAVNVSNLPCP